MDLDQEVEVCVINGKKYFLFLLTIITVGTVITIGFGKVSPLLAPFGIFIFWLGPFFIQKRLRRPFLYKIVIGLSSDKISIKSLRKETEIIEKQFEVYFDQIRAFKFIKSNKDDTSFLKFICKDSRVISYSFIGQSNEDNKTDIVDLVVKYVQQFNKKQMSVNKISLIPSLFATKRGTVYILILTFVLVILIIYQIIYKPVSIPISIFLGLALTFQIIFQRKKDVRDLKDFNNSNLD